MNPGAQPPRPIRALSANAVRLRSLPGRRPRLAGVDLELVPGRLVALVGPNGAGKSSLLLCLGGLERPDDGVIRLDGAPLAEHSRQEVARAIAYVSPWSAPDISLTVADAVSLGRLAHRSSLWQDPASAGRAAVDEAIQMTDLTTLAAVPLHALSAGERQRARLAASLAQGAPYLLLDEPTASLDPGHARAILDLARRLARSGRAVAMAVHDLTAAGQYADAVVLLNEGRIVRTGDPWEVLTPALLQAVYGTRLDVMMHPSSRRPIVVPAYDG
jgi:iron complex transport system ATP-binding protein